MPKLQARTRCGSPRGRCGHGAGSGRPPSRPSPLSRPPGRSMAGSWCAMRWARAEKPSQPDPLPQVVGGMMPKAKADTAAAVLKAMSLTEGMAGSCFCSAMAGRPPTIRMTAPIIAAPAAATPAKCRHVCLPFCSTIPSPCGACRPRRQCARGHAVCRGPSQHHDRRDHPL
jgi:hypothetical protein